MTQIDILKASLKELSDSMLLLELTPVDLVDFYLNRIGDESHDLNIMLQVDHAGAYNAAEEAAINFSRGNPRGPLDGIPVVVKDNIDVAGLPTTCGLGLSRKADKDAEVVARLRKAGAVILGKTNMDEGALAALSDNPHHGRVEHPFFPGFTPGGSSGGSAAAVTRGLCCAALGTDTLGSVRLPASYCGLVGFKPSFGRVPVAGVTALGKDFDCTGTITRKTADSRLLAQCLMDRPLMTNQQSNIRPRWGTLANIDSKILTPVVEKSFRNALEILQAWYPAKNELILENWDPGKTRRAALLLIEREAALRWASDRHRFPHAFSKNLQSMLDYGMKAGSEVIRMARQKIKSTSDSLLQALENIELIVTPTTPQSAFEFDAELPKNQADFTSLANFSGCPAISISCPVPEGSLPVGLQLISRPGSDNWLLETASNIEQMLIK